MYKFSIVIILSISIIFSSIQVNAESSFVKIYTDKQQYSFGEHLSIIIEVSEITEPFAIIHITDEEGKTSSPITIPISETSTTMTAPNTFDKTVFKAGKYVVDVEYSENTSFTEFVLFDSGEIVIPIWIKDITRFWHDGAILDSHFVDAIEFLIKNEIIVIPQTESDGIVKETTIPSWVKTNAGWWIDGLITDTEFAQGLQYLIKVGIIVI